MRKALLVLLLLQILPYRLQCDLSEWPPWIKPTELSLCEECCFYVLIDAAKELASKFERVGGWEEGFNLKDIPDTSRYFNGGRRKKLKETCTRKLEKVRIGLFPRGLNFLLTFPSAA